jgi:hypothetical protein
LDRDGSNLGANHAEIERAVEFTVGLEASDAVARLSADAGKNAAQQNLPVRLHGDSKHRKGVHVRVEGISRSGNGIEPGDVIAHRSADAVRAGEIATD